MNHEDINLITDQLARATCMNCCKYYFLPTTATCGHNLCRICWVSTITCPLCGLHVEMKALKVNVFLQDLTKHVSMLGTAYEDFFDVKLDELQLDIDEVQQVKQWLASSQNHFSAPITNSQQLTEDTNNAVQVTSEIQVHTKNKNVKDTEREIVYKDYEQADWDKIEQMSDTDMKEHNENHIGPEDIEIYDFVKRDKEFTTSNPRRSSRNKESKSNNPIIPSKIPSHKESHKIFNMNLDKESNKRGQIWGNVKKMNEEFSRLNKENRNNLNISIEMCKKTKISTNKDPTPKTQQTLHGIDDYTPEIVSICKTNSTEIKNLNINNYTQVNSEINTHINKHLPISSVNVVSSSNKESNNIGLMNEKVKETEIDANVQDINHNGDDIQNKINKSVEHNNNVTISKVSFFRKGALLPSKKHLAGNNTINDDNNASDDIEISIKIGNTLTNICIKKKEDDVKLKINTDCEVQTSLSNANNVSSNLVNELDMHNVHAGSKDSFVKVCKNAQITEVQIEKSISTKKNTASADTSTIHFEITESVEKELANNMENVRFVNNQDKTSSHKILKSDDVLKLRSPISKNINSISEDVDLLNDMDVFEGESVKESSVQLLKFCKNNPSEILMPSVKSNLKTQKNVKKRDRGVPNMEDISNNKKMKLSHDSISNDKKTRNVFSKENIIHEESEHINYDSVMSKVFADIDADIVNSHKTGNSTKQHIEINNTQNDYNKTVQQPINAKADNLNNSTVRKNFEDNVNQKHSQNVFSLIEKDINSEIFKTTMSQKFLGQTQNVKEVSPGPEKEFNLGASINAITEKLSPRNIHMDTVELSTPIQDDDDDNSVVEETPQKNASFSKSKSKIAVTTLADDVSVERLLTNSNKSVDMTEKKLSGRTTDTENVINVINITDTLGQSTKDITNATILEIERPKISNLETPSTITKFVGQIKYKSTPVARKSLNFDRTSFDDDPDATICPSSLAAAKTTQERQFMCEAFEKSLNSPTQTVHAENNRGKAKKYCIAASCLTSSEQDVVKSLCSQRNWSFVNKFIKDLTHLVVGVDNENKSQRTIKYMCALASGKWIVSYQWIEKCLQVKGLVDEEPFEALDWTGEPGPRRSRLAKRRLFRGITFYCMAPFTIVDVDTLKDMLKASGGQVVDSAKDVRVKEAPALLLAEPAHTQEDRFIYLAMELGIVPVNYEWMVNCLGSYTLDPIYDLLLCPASLLPPAISKWPPELISRCDE